MSLPDAVLLALVAAGALHLLGLAALIRWSRSSGLAANRGRPTEGGRDVDANEGSETGGRFDVDAEDVRTVTCPTCGTENESGYRFCRACVGALPGGGHEIGRNRFPSRDRMF